MRLHSDLSSLAVSLLASSLLTGCVSFSFKYSKNTINQEKPQKEVKVKENEVIPKSTLHERQNKTRIMYVADQKVVPRSIVATLQDLGYQVQFSSQEISVITGERLKHEPTKVSVTYTRQSDDFVLIRANFSANIENGNIESIWYQNFFSRLNKSLFLSTNGVQ